MDICGEALISFVCAHGDAFEFLGLAEEVFDQVAPLVDFRVDRQGRGSPWMLRDDDLGAALVEVGDDGIAVEGLVGDEALKGETLDERSDPHRVETMAAHENEADEIAQCVGQRQNFGRHAAFGTADGLALRPPFAPCPWRWTLTIVASTMAYSMSGVSDQASKSLVKTSALTQSR
jgi:hypothetical protein